MNELDPTGVGRALLTAYAWIFIVVGAPFWWHLWRTERESERIHKEIAIAKRIERRREQSTDG